MDENSVRTLLLAIADTPEPSPRISLEQALRSGRRRRLICLAAAPALAVVVAVAATLAVPRWLSTGHQERTVATPARPAPVSITAPRQFNPLVPYASFGWLPGGFSENAANGIGYGSMFSSGTGYLSLLAADTKAGHLLALQVFPRGGCDLTAARAAAVLRAHGSVQVTCTTDAFTFSAADAAPDVDGRPAVWFGAFQGIDQGIAWEYAPGAWAMLGNAITPAADEPHSRRWAAQRGWVLMPRNPTDRLTDITTPARLRTAIRSGRVIPPSAATLALLRKIAAGVVYAKAVPLTFPFQLAGTLPKGWQLSQTSFAVSADGMLAGTGIDAGPATDPTALGVSASAGAAGPAGAACPFITGQSSFVIRLGVQWVYRVLGETDKQWQNLCANGAVKGLLGADVNMDMNVPGSKVPLPGSKELGGTLGVLARLRFLGENQANWTTTPLG